jgi:HlyD family secretion protein
MPSMISSIIRYGLPIVAIAGLVFAVGYVARVNRADEPPPATKQAAQPPIAPYEDTLAGAGVVEPQSENISIGAAMPGIVAEVPVEVGQQVAEGDLLFRMDDRQLRGDLGVRQSMLDVAQAEVTRLQSQPRAEEVAVDEAQLQEALEVETEAKRQLDRILRLAPSGAATQADVDAARRAAGVATAQVAHARAALELTKAGAWQYDIMVAKQQVEQARAEVERIKTELSRL